MDGQRPAGVLATVDFLAFKTHQTMACVVRRVVHDFDHAKAFGPSQWPELGSQRHPPCRLGIVVGGSSLDIVDEIDPVRVRVQIANDVVKPLWCGRCLE